MEININCDLGEKSKFHSIENDPELLGIVNSANVACGYHAGDEETMDMVVKISKSNGVSIGAHPSFNDPENFGRKKINLSSSEVTKLIIDQYEILQKIAQKHGQNVIFSFCTEEKVDKKWAKPVIYQGFFDFPGRAIFSVFSWFYSLRGPGSKIQIFVKGVGNLLFFRFISLAIINGGDGSEKRAQIKGLLKKDRFLPVFSTFLYRQFGNDFGPCTHFIITNRYRR